MTLTNLQAANRRPRKPPEGFVPGTPDPTAPKGPRGGKRKNAGRPLGSRDRVPRKTTKMSAPDQVKRLETELGHCYRRIGDLEAELNFDKPFDGDSKALLRAVYRGEYHASPQQIYAARSSLGWEHAPATRDEAEFRLEREAWLLQDAERAREQREGDARIEALVDHSHKLAAAADLEFRERRVQLAELRDAGEISPTAYDRLMEWLGEELLLGLPAPEVGHQPDTESADAAHSGTNAGETTPPPSDCKSEAGFEQPAESPPASVEPVPVPMSPKHRGGHPVPSAVPEKGTLILFARPFQHFALPTRSYDADSSGEIRVKSEHDAKTLLRAGCRPSRNAAPLPPLQRPGYE